MISKIKAFTIEEKLLVQAILSDYFETVMSSGFVVMTWNIRALVPNNPEVKALKDFVSYVGDLQVELGVELATAGIPEEMILKAPISKAVFQSMSAEKKDTIRELLVLLGEKLGANKIIGNKAYFNIWNNKLKYDG